MRVKKVSRYLLKYRTDGRAFVALQRDLDMSQSEFDMCKRILTARKNTEFKLDFLTCFIPELEKTEERINQLCGHTQN